MKFITLILCFFTCAFSDGPHAPESNTRTFKATVKANENTTVNFNFFTGTEAIVTNSKDDNIHIQLMLELHHEDDLDRLSLFPENPEILKQKGNEVWLDLEFLRKVLYAKGKGSAIKRLFNKIFTGKSGENLVMENGTLYNVISHYLKVEIRIPKVHGITLKNAYGKFELDHLVAERIQIKSREGESYLSNLTGRVEIENKYAQTHITNITGDLRADLYQSETEINGVSGHLDVINKYAHLSVKNIKGNAVLDCYETDISGTDFLGDLNLINKYSPVKLRTIGGKAELDLYQSDFEADSIGGALDLVSKYGKINIGAVNGDVIGDSYQGEMKINHVIGDLRLKKSYESLELQHISGNINLELYQAPCRIEHAGKNVTLSSKYDNITLKNVAGNVALDLYEVVSILENIGGDLKIETKYGSGKLLQIKGHTEIESYQFPMRLRDLATVSIKDKYSTIELSGQFSDTDISGYSSEISIDAEKEFLAPIDLIATHGLINLRGLNENLFRLRVRAHNGQIHTTKLSDLLNEEKDQLMFNWRDKEKPSIQITTNTADVFFR